jgi:phenylacetate-CoA ligase
MNERYLNAFDMTEAKMKDFAEMLIRWQPAVIYGYASALALFARFLKEEGITGIRPRLVESTSEKLAASQRELLEAVFQCRVVDNYSSREMGIMAFEAENGERLVTADVRYLEIVAEGQTVTAGEMGEVVLTSLYQFSWPFIRYKIRDMASYATGSSGTCRAFPVLKEIVGRTNDTLVTSEGKFVHSGFFDRLFTVKTEVIRYQVYQSDRDHLEIRLVCNTQVTSAWLDAVSAEVRERFGRQTRITIRQVDDIPLTRAGKHRCVVSEVEPNFV